MKSEKGLMHLLILVEVVVLILIVLAGIAKQVTEPQKEIRIPTDVTQNQIIEEPVIEPETPTETQTEETEEIEPVVFSAEVEAMLSAMSLEEKIATAAAFGQAPISSCAYCKGFDVEGSVRYKAAEQIVGKVADEDRICL